MKTPQMLDPKLHAQLVAQGLERAARVSAKPATSKPKRIAPANVSRVASHEVSTAMSRGDFAHLLNARSLMPSEPPAASSGTRRPALTREQSAALAKRIVAANNRRIGVTTDADDAQARAQAEADLTPTARKILAVARRIGLA